jgi:alkylglycerol monooxygenase
MHVNILGFAIPLFIRVYFTGIYIAKKKGLQYFNLHNSIANISIGIAERLADVFVAGMFYFIYDTVQKKYGLFSLSIMAYLYGYFYSSLLTLYGTGIIAWDMK